MPPSRLDFQYRGCRIIAAHMKNRPTARGYRGKLCVVEAAGIDLPSAAVEVKKLVDQMIHGREGGVPSASEYEQALLAIADGMPPGHLAMLRAHRAAKAGDPLCGLPDRTMTAEQLAEAAGYTSYAAANLQYGLLGRRVAEILDYMPPLSDDRGEPVWTMTLATGERSSGNLGLWNWTLRPEVAEAMRRLGWG